MKSFKIINKQMGILIAVFAVVFASFAPAVAFAATLTQRSATLSSSSKSATPVSYEFTFTTGSGTSGAAVIYFCSNTPLIGEVCDLPADFTAAGAGVTNGTGVTGAAINNAAAKRVVVTGTFTSSSANTFTLTGITNPSVADTMYARVVTFADAAAASTYAGDPETLGASPVDQGSMAISITDSVAVSGAVLETLTFCVSSAVITANCANAAMQPLVLGETSGDVVALSTGAVSTGSVYTQLTTNAVGGAVVRVKSNALACGGLLRAGAPGACDILPANTGNTGITLGQAKFGVIVADAVATSGYATPIGTLQIANGSIYDDTAYAFNYVTGDATGVTSVYGDPLLDSDNAPVDNMNAQLTFGASISNNTPAGNYSTDLSLVATGKF